ncbi:MAG: DNA repair protein RecN [Hyphomicrobiales bacterium]
MLSALSIRDIVLIEKLDIDFLRGLSVLTGETGAGKSILLDALGLALGARGDAGLVRTGAQRGIVTAAFELPEGHPIFGELEEAGIESSGDFVVRRIQSADGRSRASVNDQPVSVNLLRRMGRALAEIHGQHDDRAMMDANQHRGLVDAYGSLETQVNAVSDAWHALSGAQEALAAHEERLAHAEQERAYLEHAVEELRALDAKAGEEEDLAERRQLMMNAEKFVDALNDANIALSDNNLEAQLAASLRKLERRQGDAGGRLDTIIGTLDRILVDLGELRNGLNEAKFAFSFDPSEQDRINGRLFALKDAARKYRCQVEELPSVAERLSGDLASLDEGSGHLEELKREVARCREAYFGLAEELSTARRMAANAIDSAVMEELPPLKLDKARFATAIETGDTFAGPAGIDHIEFSISANPGTPAGPLTKVASGGELSRVMLALKVVLAAKGSAPTLIFDEIDTGVGGATAAAVGQRLARLAHGLQTLAVTHSPQVAARANAHMLISKMEEVGDGDTRMVTRVSHLGQESRREEIARMLSGAQVTDEARAQAERLLADTG